MSCFGWGTAALAALRTSAPTRTDGASITLLGWSSILIVLQLTHFVSAITPAASIAIFGAGLLMSVPVVWRHLKESGKKAVPFSVILIGAALVVVAAWVASKGMYRIESFDSGFYHLSTIRWIESYHVVPGLGNLHGRLAFNQSFFTYVAALNGAWFSGHGSGAANGFLFLVVLTQSIQGVWRYSSRSAVVDPENVFTVVPSILVIPILFYIALSTEGFDSPTPDLAATLMQLSMFLLFCRIVGNWRASGDENDFLIAALPVLAATAITVKLSTLALSGALIALCFIKTFAASRNDRAAVRRTLIRLCIVAGIMCVWSLHGLVLSGCPMYPATAGCLRLDWAVPLAKVTSEADWIYSWAREPGVDPQIVLADWSWLKPWSMHERRDAIGFLFPAIASLALLGSAMIMRVTASRKSRSAPPLTDLLLLVPVLAGMAFWFFTAPDPRFGRAPLWILMMISAVVFLRCAGKLVGTRAYRAVTAAIVLVLSAPFVVYVITRGGQQLRAISTAGWSDVPSSTVIARQTASGLTVYVPASGQQCWNAPLPCTPYFSPNLALRVKGDMGSGFVNRGGLSDRSSGPLP